MDYIDAYKDWIIPLAGLVVGLLALIIQRNRRFVTIRHAGTYLGHKKGTKESINKDDIRSIIKVQSGVGRSKIELNDGRQIWVLNRRGWLKIWANI